MEFAIRFLLLLSFFSVASAANKVYVTTRDVDTGEVVEEEEVTNFCYEFTWLGPEDEDVTNITSSCDDITTSVEYAGLPCFEPLVWTTGDNKLNGPNLTQIEQQCASSDTVDGTSCDPLCTRDELSCIKMTYYNRDDDKTIAYQTRFCGTGIETSDSGNTLTSGCHKQESDPEYDIEACICQDRDRCNGADDKKHLLVAPLLLAAAQTALGWMLR